MLAPVDGTRRRSTDMAFEDLRMMIVPKLLKLLPILPNIKIFKIRSQNVEKPLGKCTADATVLALVKSRPRLSVDMAA